MFSPEEDVACDIALLALEVLDTGQEVAPMRRPVTLGFVIWIVIGLVVAANKDFLGHLDTVSGFLSAVLAVLAWPLVLLEVHVAI
jgi:ABC-type anion transport system duplicated permease subunit